MKFIQTGDIHLRVRPEIPEWWQVSRYTQLFAKLLELCREYQAMLILSGDIFERNHPSLIELKLFIEFMDQLKKNRVRTYIFAGNHESIGQGKSTFDYLAPVFDAEVVSYYQTATQVPTSEGVELVFIGHPYIFKSRTWSFIQPTRILISHFRCNVNQFIREEIDVEELIKPFDICFASDIHEPLELYGGKLVYTNNPLNNHFETKPDCGCLLISVEGGEVSWERIPLHLPNLIQITTTAAEYREPPEDGNFYRYEIKGSSVDLREIISRSETVKLLKVPELAETYTEEEEPEEVKDTTLEEALTEYMQSLDFSETKIQDMLEVYRAA